jgi:hypothetical protein
MGFGAGEALTVLWITTLGGLVMAVLDALDGDTIWSGWVLHASLNASWSVFDTGSDSAAGSWAATAVRLTSAALAIGLLWQLRRRRRLIEVGSGAHGKQDTERDGAGHSRFLGQSN